MGVLVSAEALFCGIKTGKNKRNEDYIQLQFKVPETYKGISIPASQLPSANLNIFPKEGDFTGLKVGTTYFLELSVSGRKDSMYPDFQLITLKPI